MKLSHGTWLQWSFINLKIKPIFLSQQRKCLQQLSITCWWSQLCGCCPSRRMLAYDGFCRCAGYGASILDWVCNCNLHSPESAVVHPTISHPCMTVGWAGILMLGPLKLVQLDLLDLIHQHLSLAAVRNSALVLPMKDWSDGLLYDSKC